MFYKGFERGATNETLSQYIEAYHPVSDPLTGREHKDEDIVSTYKCQSIFSIYNVFGDILAAISGFCSGLWGILHRVRVMTIGFIFMTLILIGIGIMAPIVQAAFEFITSGIF